MQSHEKLMIIVDPGRQLLFLPLQMWSGDQSDYLVQDHLLGDDKHNKYIYIVIMICMVQLYRTHHHFHKAGIVRLGFAMG
jgi:hypothetical protein